MVKTVILDALAEVSNLPKEDILLEVPSQESHGDYSTNIALRGEGNPRINAENIVKKLLEVVSLKQFVSDIEVAGPGFINFKLSNEYLIDTLQEIFDKGGDYGKSNVGAGKKVLVEYSSPNIAKGFGIGHLRSTIIGQALFNIYSFLGYDVVGENHLGDWGTQFGMVLAQIDRKKLEADKLSVEELERLYVEFNKEIDVDPELRLLAKEWFKKLENGDEEARSRWEAIRETSLTEFERIYDLLNVSIENSHGESFYEDKMQSVVDEFRNRGLTTMSEGAEIVELGNDMPPALLLKSDGTTTYFTRDLAAIKYRIETWDPSVFIYEVGADQILHFRQVFAAAEKVGWTKERYFEHVAHGLIRFPEGKMSTRKGKTVKLEDVLGEAISRATKVIQSSETNRGLSEEEVEELAKQVGIGAVKYFDLMHTPQSEIVFDWEKMFVLTGNSGPYLQYTYSRINSLLEKSSGEFSITLDSEVTAEEVGVMRQLVHFPEVIETVGKSYSPNILTNYLFELASKFNTFYNAHKILGSENESFRRTLASNTSTVLHTGLELLGISTPERM